MTDKFIDLQPAILEDDLVKIMPIQKDDFERLYLVASDPQIWEQHPSNNRYKKDVFQAYFDEAIASKSAFIVFDKATDELIGCTRFYEYNPEQSNIAIGFTFLAKKFWGGHYNRSMKNLLLNFAFTFVNTVIFHIGSTNIRSQKALLKLGGKKTKEVDRGHAGNPSLHFEYEIMKQDWNY